MEEIHGFLADFSPGFQVVPLNGLFTGGCTTNFHSLFTVYRDFPVNSAESRQTFHQDFHNLFTMPFASSVDLKIN